MRILAAIEDGGLTFCEALASRLSLLGCERISDIAISPTDNDQREVIILGRRFADNIHYQVIKDLFIKQRSSSEPFYIRSWGDGDTNLLLHKHAIALQKDGVFGVFSIGGGLNEDGDEIWLCICQIIDGKRSDAICDVFSDDEAVIRWESYPQNRFSEDSLIIFAQIRYGKV